MKKKTIQTFPEPLEQTNQEESQEKLIKSLKLLVDCNVISEKDSEKELYDLSDVIEVLSKLTDVIERSPEATFAVKDQTSKDFYALFKR